MTEALDPALVPPHRLKLMALLSATTSAEFVVLREALDVSDSVLSKHVSLLAGLGYVRSRKGMHRGRRTTWVSLTPAGRDVLGAHVRALRALIDGVA